MKRIRGTCLVLPLILILALAFALPFGPAAPAAGGAGEKGMGLLLSRPDDRLVGNPMKYRTNAVLASSVDLSSDIPPIGDQGQRGSCVGWSSGYYLKSWWEML